MTKTQELAESHEASQVVVSGGLAADRSRIRDTLMQAGFQVMVQADTAIDAPLSIHVVGDDSQVDLFHGLTVDWHALAVDLVGQDKTIPLALLVLNIDHFKRARSVLGADQSHDLLREVAQRFKQTLKDFPGLEHQETRLAHIGGDEFAILIPYLADPEKATQIANALLIAVSRPYDDIAVQVYLTARVGIAFYPTDGADIETLARYATSMVHHDLAHGRNSVRLYAEGYATMAAERFELESELSGAIHRDELEVYYQPLVSLKTGVIIGAEALVRWRHPIYGVVPAEVFVALAEDIGLIAELGTAVLTTAATQCRAWQKEGHPPIRVSINTSAYQFRRLDMVDVVRRALKKTKLDPGYLTLEVTESLVISDVERTLKSLVDLREMGVRIVLDDFGTGYSSMSYLKSLALDGLKIDRSFVEGLPSDRGDYAVAEAIVRMAKALNLDVTAEGVEREDQRDCLAKLGCDTYQGYLAARALPADEFVKLLQKAAG